MTDTWKEYSENEVTHSAAHHLVAISDLTVKRGYARVSDVAKYLNITTGSVSTNLKALKLRGLVTEDENKFLALTLVGAKIAAAVQMRREVLLRFFIDVLEVDPVQAEIDACKTEHLLSLETATRLAAFTKRQVKSRRSKCRPPGKSG